MEAHQDRVDRPADAEPEEIDPALLAELAQDFAPAPGEPEPFDLFAVLAEIDPGELDAIHARWDALRSQDARSPS